MSVALACSFRRRALCFPMAHKGAPIFCKQSRVDDPNVSPMRVGRLRLLLLCGRIDTPVATIDLAVKRHFDATRPKHLSFDRAANRRIGRTALQVAR